MVKWAIGLAMPAISTATELGLDAFFKDYCSKQLSAPMLESISVSEMPLVACLLNASDLTIVASPGLWGTGSQT